MNVSEPQTNNSMISAVIRHGLCAGCGLCESIAPRGHIQIRMNADGFLRPVILKPLSEDVERQISEVCPGVSVGHTAIVRGYHTIWGPLIRARTGHALDDETRWKGSSGGTISALAAYLLSSGKVDFVAHIAVSKDDPLTTELQVNRTREDVLRAAGSRYAPSAPLRTLRDLLETGQRFAFIGKPCDIAALRSYVKLHRSAGEQIPYMLSFMCAGVPSQKGTYEVLRQLGVDPEAVVSFSYRGNGWPGVARAIHKDGRCCEMDYSTSWGTILSKHIQFRCKICPDGTGEFADVVCADAWYGKDGYPDFQEREGRSLILSRTDAGEMLIHEAVAAGTLSVTDLPVDEIASMQPYQVKRKQLVLGRVLGTRLATGMAPKYSRLSLVKASFGSNPVEWLRHAWGTYRRAKGEPQ